MTKVVIKPSVTEHWGVAGHVGIAEMAKEPSLFSCSLEHANVICGPITEGILDRVTKTFRMDMHKAYQAGLSEVIDVRVQRLMPGMYPSIPGWHCDAVPRANYFSQPDFSLLNPNAFHVVCIVDTNEKGISDTQYLLYDFEWEYDDKEPVWKQLHKYVDNEKNGLNNRRQYEAGNFIKFNSLTPHRARPCHTRGWRLFFRLSMYHNPPVANGSQNAQQVYILSEENG